ncbi:MAG: RidA family protein [Burkholderiaceae bacterium]
MTPYERLKQLNLELPTPAVPLANYVPFVLANGFLYLSGQGPRRLDGGTFTGKVGADVSLEDAYQHAQLTGLNLIAVAHLALGDLARVRRVVKVLGMVNAAPTFGDHPKVINGCSDLFVKVFGEAGKHARSAVGMGSLPGNISVEIEVILQVDG